MVTDVVTIGSDGQGMDAALDETEKAAVYNELTHKQRLRLRLLAEEMMGMFRTIVGEKATYWVESDGKAFSLHLAAGTKMDSGLRQELLETSTSGKNAAAKGFMGTLRDIFMRMSESDGYETVPIVPYASSEIDLMGLETGEGATQGMMYSWSLMKYRKEVESCRDRETEKWDELEKSITAKLADEIKIFIRVDHVEMEIDKAFE